MSIGLPVPVPPCEIVQERFRAFEPFEDVYSPWRYGEFAHRVIEIAVTDLENGNEPVKARAHLGKAQ
jgi:hypothetical protein